MASEFIIQVQGDRELLQVLANLRGRFSNLAPMWREVGARLVKTAKLRFWRKIDPAGRPWPGWSRSYERWRKRKTGAVGRESLLELTGHMRDSINSNADDAGVTLGMGRVYAPFHETGTRKMPRRAVFLASTDPAELGEQDRRLVIDTLMEFLRG